MPRFERGGNPIGEGVEPQWMPQVMVIDDIQAHVHRGAQNISDKRLVLQKKSQDNQRGHQFIGMQDKDQAARAIPKVIGEESEWIEAPLAFNEHVIHVMIQVDPESTRKGTRGELPRAGGQVCASRSGGGGEYMAFRFHWMLWPGHDHVNR